MGVPHHMISSSLFFIGWWLWYGSPSDSNFRISSEPLKRLYIRDSPWLEALTLKNRE
jgi:hypothetical protein